MAAGTTCSAPERQRGLTPEEAASIRLFRSARVGDLYDLLKDCPLRELKAGEVLIAAGDVGTQVFFLVAGVLTVHLDTPDNDPVARLEAGESVGEISLIDGKPRSAFVVAAEPSLVLEAKEDLCWSILRASPDVALNLLKILADRLRGNNRFISGSLRIREEYRRKASMDWLTGIYNRRWLDEMLPRQIRRSVGQGTPLALLMVDVDHFKSYNDNYGHQAGDFVLFALARMTRELLRPTDMLVRYGGEEFIIVLPETDRAAAYAVAERLRLGVKGFQFILPDDTRLPGVTVSIGVAEMEPGQSMEKMVEQADVALYRSKASGRDQTSF